jgi:unsaturated rhamnogalacturonyl hydrolase
MKELVVSVLICVLAALSSVPKERQRELLPNAGHGRNAGAGTLDSLRIPTTWPWAKRIAESFVLRHPGSVTYDSGSPNRRWNYEQGLMLEALHQMWLLTNDKRYFDFIKGNIDQYVEGSGTIRTYEYEDFNLDNIAVGRALLTLYEVTGVKKYKYAADTLRLQLKKQPRTHEGGFWHKQIYPYQVWLDGLFMAEPFYAWYAVMFKEPEDFDDIANQFVFIYGHTRDPKTGLLYHAWDESKQQRWANPETGCSPNFWGRAMGWYGMALVDVLDFLPANHPRRQELVSILRTLSAALLKFQDKKTRLWYQVVDQGSREGNYLEASASSMFAYVFAKGANKGYVGRKYFEAARATFRGIAKTLVTVDANGFVDLHHTCQGAGLGGRPYRDGSYDYYVSEPQRTNDMKGYGPFLLAAIELQKGDQRTKSINAN